MLNWDEIAADVAEGMAEAGFPITLTRAAQGAYDPETGSYGVTISTVDGFAVVASDAAIDDVFTDYIVGPGDELLMIYAEAVAENDALLFEGRNMIVRKVKDLTGAAFLWHVVAR